jgi:hypothetical protein
MNLAEVTEPLLADTHQRPPAGMERTDSIIGPGNLIADAQQVQQPLD